MHCIVGWAWAFIASAVAKMIFVHATQAQYWLQQLCLFCTSGLFYRQFAWRVFMQGTRLLAARCQCYAAHILLNMQYFHTSTELYSSKLTVILSRNCVTAKQLFPARGLLSRSMWILLRLVLYCTNHFYKLCQMFYFRCMVWLKLCQHYFLFLPFSCFVCNFQLA